MRNNITPSQHYPEDDSLLTARLSIIQERLRQAHRSFDFALIATALSFGISLVGAGCLIANKASEGTVTTAIGLVASMRYIQIAKDANNRLDKILADLDTE